MLDQSLLACSIGCALGKIRRQKSDHRVLQRRPRHRRNLVDCYKILRQKDIIDPLQRQKLRRQRMIHLIAQRIITRWREIDSRQNKLARIRVRRLAHLNCPCLWILYRHALSIPGCAARVKWSVGIGNLSHQDKAKQNHRGPNHYPKSQVRRILSVQSALSQFPIRLRSDSATLLRTAAVCPRLTLSTLREQVRTSFSLPFRMAPVRYRALCNATSKHFARPP